MTIPVKHQAMLFALLLMQMQAFGQKIFFVEKGNHTKPSGTENAPFQSIEQAIHQANIYWKTSDQDVVIYIKPGEYYLEEPLVLSPETLSNKKETTKLTIAGQGAPLPVISGGRKVEHWTSAGNDLFSASWNGKPFRQLYSEGKRLIRAREPDCDYHRLNWDLDNKNILVGSEWAGFKFNDGRTEIFIQKIWSCQIFRINALSNSGSETRLKLLPQDELVFDTRNWQIKENTSFHLENNFQFLDSDNEWFLDKEEGLIYLYKSDISGAEKIVAEAPQLENLLLIQGAMDSKLSNIKISNLIFENTNWTLPDSIGLYAGQATYIYELRENQPKNGAVIIENATEIEFSNNTIRNAGGNALMLYHNVDRSKILANTIHDISANGIVIDWNLNKDLKTRSYSNHVDVKNNLITRIGRDYFGSIGIVTGYAHDLNIESNFVYNVPYTGISAGWGHTYDSTSLRNIHILYNYVGNALTQMSDGAGIYTLSNQPGTVVASNFIENIIQSKWSIGRDHVYGIYLDEGSHNITVNNNRFSNVTKTFVTNSSSGVNEVKLENEISPEEFTQKNKLYRKYDSLRAFLFEDKRCVDFSRKNAVAIVPNPLIDDFYIITDFDPADNIQYEIYAADGRKIALGNAALLRNKVYFSRLPVKLKVGAYIIRIFTENGDHSIKVMVGG